MSFVTLLAAGAFNPDDMPSLIVDFDFTDSSLMSLGVGNTVDSVTAKAGTYTLTHDINTPCIFTGNSCKSQNASHYDLNNNIATAKFTSFIKFKPASTSTLSCPIAATANNFHFIPSGGFGKRFVVRIRTDAGPVGQSSILTMGNTLILCATGDGSNLQLYVNNIADGTGTGAQNDSMRMQGMGNLSTNDEIYRIMIFDDVLSEDDRTSVFSYLNNL